MKVAVISDIHGNGVALDAALADLQREAPDRIVCLGDAAQGGPQPAQVLARLRELACPVVIGNADAWMLDGDQSGAEIKATPQMWETRDWSLAQLSEADRAFVRSFQPTVK